MNHDHEWATTLSLVQQLWPNFEPTHAIQHEYESRLRHRPAEAVRAAIKDHYAKDAGADFAPKLSRIIERITAESKPSSWTPEESEREAVQADHRRMLAEVESWTPLRFTVANEFIERIFPRSDKAILEKPFADWPRFSIGCLHGADAVLNGERR